MDFATKNDDIYNMKTLYIFLIIICSSQAIFAEDADSLFDNNTAFYEGKSYSYIIAPPENFKMNSEEATDDGYSFAFIPKAEKYSQASIIIGINIFKIKASKDSSFTLDKLISFDTTSAREHFGKDVEISEVKAIETATTDKLRTIYFNSDAGIIPNVMMSYFDGKSEIIIFELNITDRIARFQAEQIYLECLQQIKILTKGKLEVG